MQPIETRYKGYRFRSRLEARWAVFFDALGIEWLYERQGYNLGESDLYLPDFWIPYMSFSADDGKEWGFWIEIKPIEPNEREQRLMSKLAEQTGHRTFCFCGSPGLKTWTGWAWDHPHGGNGGRLIVKNGTPEFTETRERWFGENGQPETVGFGVNGVFCVRSKSDTEDTLRFPMPFLLGLKSLEQVAFAFEAATSARFEHGETPNVFFDKGKIKIVIADDPKKRRKKR